MSRKVSAVMRLNQDYLRLKKDPVPYVEAEPLPSNMLEWYYVVKGPENTPYEGGYYLGKLLFPREYPFKPPSILMLTPNGRFKINTRLCLSISDYHPDTWNPAWSVATILAGLLSFMLEKSPTLGSIECPESERRAFAYNSLEYNLRIPAFRELFPSMAKSFTAELKKRRARFPSQRSSKNKSANNRNGATGRTDRVVSLEEDNAGNGKDHEPCSVVANICLIFGFAIFAVAVRYVIVNMNAG